MKTRIAIVIAAVVLLLLVIHFVRHKNAAPAFILIHAPTDGVTDAAPIINSTITQAIAATPPVNHFILPCGFIRIRSAINMTLQQAGSILEGCGRPLDFQLLNIGATSESNGGPPFSNETAILCDTGSACIDASGSQTIKIRTLKLVLNPAFPTPSTVGILTGRVNYQPQSTGLNNPYCWAQFNEIDSVSIMAGSIAGANNGYGSVGIANIGAEHFLVRLTHITADSPFILDDRSTFSSPYLGPLQTGCPISTTIITGIGDSFATKSPTGIAVQANDTHDVVFQNLHTLIGQSFQISGSSSNWHVQGQFESATTPAPLVKLLGNIDHLNLQAATADWTPGSTGAFVQFGAPNISITNSNLSVSVINGANQPLIQNLAGTTISGGELDLSTTSSPANLANVTITGGTIIKAPGMQVTLPKPCDCLLLH